MSNAIIEVNTGFVGGIHEYDTELSIDEWNELSDDEQSDYHRDAIGEYISTNMKED